MNFLLAVFNVIVGLISNSLAIVSDAVHSLTDSVSGLLIIFSEKIAARYDREDYRLKVERVTTIIIAVIIVVLGVELIVESVEKIRTPEEPDYSAAAFIVLIASIAVKYWLASRLKKTGRDIGSDVLVASGAETMNDTWISVIVFVSAVIYRLLYFNIEAYASILIALVIIKTGLEFIFPHMFSHHHHHLESNPDHDHCGKV